MHLVKITYLKHNHRKKAERIYARPIKMVTTSQKRRYYRSFPHKSLHYCCNQLNKEYFKSINFISPMRTRLHHAATSLGCALPFVVVTLLKALTSLPGQRVSAGQVTSLKNYATQKLHPFWHGRATRQRTRAILSIMTLEKARKGRGSPAPPASVHRRRPTFRRNTPTH